MWFTSAKPFANALALALLVITSGHVLAEQHYVLFCLFRWPEVLHGSFYGPNHAGNIDEKHHPNKEKREIGEEDDARIRTFPDYEATVQACDWYRLKGNGCDDCSHINVTLAESNKTQAVCVSMSKKLNGDTMTKYCRQFKAAEGFEPPYSFAKDD